MTDTYRPVKQIEQYKELVDTYKPMCHMSLNTLYAKPNESVQTFVQNNTFP